jgi:hypothetical protein
MHAGSYPPDRRSYIFLMYNSGEKIARFALPSDRRTKRWCGECAPKSLNPGATRRNPAQLKRAQAGGEKKRKVADPPLNISDLCLCLSVRGLDIAWGWEVPTTSRPQIDFAYDGPSMVAVGNWFSVNSQSLSRNMSISKNLKVPLNCKFDCDAKSGPKCTYACVGEKYKKSIDQKEARLFYHSKLLLGFRDIRGM